jgi:hypothetical protein
MVPSLADFPVYDGGDDFMGEVAFAMGHDYVW